MPRSRFGAFASKFLFLNGTTALLFPDCRCSGPKSNCTVVLFLVFLLPEPSKPLFFVAGLNSAIYMFSSESYKLLLVSSLKASIIYLNNRFY